MKIFLLGATGQTGSIFMKMALERNHKVTAYVRSPEKVLLHNENLNIVKGDVFSLADMAKAMASHDVVVSCLGRNNNDKETVITKMTEIIIKSMKANEINRIVTISTAGIHDEFLFVMNFIVKSFLKHTIHDYRLAAEAIISSGLVYTIARPLALTKGPLTEVYRMTPEGVPRGGKEISRQDLTHFLLSIIVKDEFKNETVGLAY